MHQLKSFLQECGQKADFWSIYSLRELHEEIRVRKGREEPIFSSDDYGALITVMKDGAIAYASTQDLSKNGIVKAFDSALDWALKLKKYSLLKDVKNPFSAHKAQYKSSFKKSALSAPLYEKRELLHKTDKILGSHKSIVDCESSLWSIESFSLYENSLGAEISQEIFRIIPSLSATAHANGITQNRSLGGMRAYCQQKGFELLDEINFVEKVQHIVKDAVDLVHAENCPSGNMDILIDPDQMMLQIHESIGHPLELDRILGDERNYAGTSFVTLDMFGKYQYGSALLNVTFDPEIKEEFASYAYDDEGTKAEKSYLIKDGILLRPLGAALAQARASMPGVANARSSSWNRAPIDRMANLNIEPGSSSFDDMLAGIKKGLYLKSNSSWSIDDSRNKFQFGCEWAQLIENGKLTKVVRNPNYRGISAQFWRSLAKVGNAQTQMVMGSPYCGKGEPNQCIRVGHASPVCLFSNVDVFGGE
jgi:predicted Zn-dependent protease